jgi:hypothetical protein
MTKDNLKIEQKIQINNWEKGITAFQPTLLIQIKEAQLPLKLECLNKF